MICSQWGNNVAEGMRGAPGAGRRRARFRGQRSREHGVVRAKRSQAWHPAQAWQPAHAGRTRPGPGRRAGRWGPGTAAPAFNLDLKRLTRNDRIVGGATIVFVISLFLPWFTVSDGVFSASVNGLWHGYMYIALILAFAVLAYLVLHAGFEQLPFKLPLGHEQAMLVATAPIFVLTVLSFVFKPAGASDAFASVNWGWSFGAVIGLAAAVVSVLPLGLPFLRSRTGS